MLRNALFIQPIFRFLVRYTLLINKRNDEKRFRN